MTAAGLASQVLDVSSANLGDPQPVEYQETHDRLGLRVLFGGRGEQRPDVVLGDRPAARLPADPRAFHTGGRRARQEPPVDQVGVERTAESFRATVAAAYRGRPFAADRPSGPINSASQLR